MTPKPKSIDWKDILGHHAIIFVIVCLIFLLTAAVLGWHKAMNLPGGAFGAAFGMTLTWQASIRAKLMLWIMAPLYHLIVVFIAAAFVGFSASPAGNPKTGPSNPQQKAPAAPRWDGVTPLP